MPTCPRPTWAASSYWRAVDSALRSTCPGVDWRTYTTARRRRCDAVILPLSLIADLPTHGRGGGVGDQAGQLLDRRRDARLGKLAEQVRQWRRHPVRQQTQLCRLHAHPPGTMGVVQSASLPPPDGATAPIPARPRAGDLTATPPPAHALRRPAPDRSTTRASRSCCPRAAPPAAPARRRGVAGRAPATPAPRGGGGRA